MRRSELSRSRQPCSACSLHTGMTNRSSGLEQTAVWLPTHFKVVGFQPVVLARLRVSVEIA